MPLFVAICIDKPGALDLRLATREAHVNYVRAEPGKMKLAGPFLDEAGEMAGSLIIFEAPDHAAAKAWTDADPYNRAGLFERVEVRPWKATIGTIA
jgi:uncharacterized protein YciI